LEAKGCASKEAERGAQRAKPLDPCSDEASAYNERKRDARLPRVKKKRDGIFRLFSALVGFYFYLLRLLFYAYIQSILLIFISGLNGRVSWGFLLLSLLWPN
jgi:hypothetical protein